MDTKEFEKRLLEAANLSDEYIAKIRKECQQNDDRDLGNVAYD